METFAAATAYHSPIESLSCPHCGQREAVERVASLVAGGVTPMTSTIGRMPMVLGTGHAHAMERWSHLYYCTDCHCVFTPGMAACIPHRQVRASLYS